MDLRADTRTVYTGNRSTFVHVGPIGSRVLHVSRAEIQIRRRVHDTGSSAKSK